MKTTIAQRIKFQNEFKAKRKDNPIILFRDNDFYLAYNEDAETLGQIFESSLKITKVEDYTFISFSFTKLDIYLPAIIRRGHKVAICDGEIK